MSKSSPIVVDFDGTCVTHEYPLVGSDIGAVPVLKALVKNGHKLILSTMRSNKPFKKPDGTIDTSGLDDAVNWFKENGIQLYGVQTNPTQKYWTDSPKAYGSLHIDDAGIGCPLLQDWYGEHTGDEINTCPVEQLSYKSVRELIGRPYVDWVKVERILRDKGLIAFEPEITPQEAIGMHKTKTNGLYQLFLDDERNPIDVYNMNPDKWFREIYKNKFVVVRNYDEFVAKITADGFPTFISFDHDLGDFDDEGNEKTGYDCAKWLVEECIERGLDLPLYFAHSKNEVGAENISLYLHNFQNRKFK